MEIITATMGAVGAEGRMAEWIGRSITKPSVLIIDNRERNRGLLTSYQEGYERSTADILAYIHDDVVIHEDGWDERVLKEFEDPAVGVVGFGGARQHGADDIYKTPYQLVQLRRIGYLSNTDDAELHGERFAGAYDVATLDGFALVVRRDLLDLAGGWPVAQLSAHHCYDYWLTCIAHRYRYLVRLVGVGCHHLGGLTATSPAYLEWVATTRWGSDAKMHEAGHRFIYDEFRDVLPFRVKEVEDVALALS